MSIKLMTRVWELEVGHPEQAVLLALADWADDEGLHLFPSQRRVAWKTGYSERQVRRILKELEAAGALVVLQKGNQYQRTQYKLDLTVLPEKPEYVQESDRSPGSLLSQVPPGSTGQDGRSSSGESTGQTEQEHRTATAVDRTSATSEPDTDVRLSVNEPSSETVVEPSELAPVKQRNRDLRWEAFVIETGVSPETSAERGKWNQGLAQLKSAGLTDANVGDLVDLIRAYQERYGPAIPCHPQTLAAGLGELRRWMAAGRPAKNGNGKPEPGSRERQLADEWERRFGSGDTGSAEGARAIGSGVR